VVRLLLEGADANAQGGDYGNAPQAASTRDHERVMRLLLEKGADVESMAMRAASAEDHKKVVQLLLEKCANIEVGSMVVHSWLH
jgi:Ankyrin repeats (3 copies)